MNIPHQSVTQIGLVHFMAFPFAMSGEGDIIASIERLAEDDFFSLLEITTIKDPVARAAARSIAAAAHMDLGYCAIPIILGNKLNVNALDESERLAVVSRLKESIDEAHEIGASMWTFLAGPYAGEETETEQLDALTRSTLEFCRHAEPYGITVDCEQFDRSIEKKSLIGPAALTRSFAERIRSEVDNFGICLDLSHLPILGEKAADIVPLMGDYFIHAHAGNAYLKDPDDPFYGDQHPRFGYPESENDVAELADYIEVLWSSGYFHRHVPSRLPVFTFEIKTGPAEDVGVMLSNTKRVFFEAWGKAST